MLYDSSYEKENDDDDAYTYGDPHTYGMFPPSMSSFNQVNHAEVFNGKTIQTWKIDLLVAIRELYMKKLYSISVKDTKEEDLPQGASGRRWVSVRHELSYQ